MEWDRFPRPLALTLSCTPRRAIENLQRCRRRTVERNLKSDGQSVWAFPRRLPHPTTNVDHALGPVAASLTKPIPDQQ